LPSTLTGAFLFDKFLQIYQSWLCENADVTAEQHGFIENDLDIKLIYETFLI
jgi:hypothetical protein